MKLAWPELPDGERAEALAWLGRLYARANRLRDGGLHVPATFPADRLAWLAERGLAPNQRLAWTHDELVRAVRGARVTVRGGAAAFVASLDGGVPHGAFLEGAQLAQALPVHAHAGGDVCAICGARATNVVDVAELYASWYGAGSGIPGDLVWARVALALWKPTVPSERATRTLARILATLDAMPRTAAATQAIRAVHALGVFAGDRPVRGKAQAVVETLAFAGLLDAPPHVGMATRFVTFEERDARPTTRTEVDAPLGFWRARHGVTWANAIAVFGMDREQARELAKSGDKPTIAARAAAAVRATAPTVRGLGLPRRPPRAGDGWALRIREDLWIGVYVWRVAKIRGRLYATVEYLDCERPELPAATDLARAGVRPRPADRWQMRAHSLEKTPGIVLVAEKLAAPADAVDFAGPTASGRDLIHLAAWCFPAAR